MEYKREERYCLQEVKLQEIVIKSRLTLRVSGVPEIARRRKAKAKQRKQFEVRYS